MIAKLAIVMALTSVLSAGTRWPSLTGHRLSGTRATLPEAAAGRPAVLLIGFTYASRTAVEAYGDWYRQTFAGDDRVTFFEIPIIGGMATMARWFIDSGMRRGTPANLHDHVITVYADSGLWKARLGVTDANDHDAFVVVLDRDGTIAWLGHGPFSDERAAEIAAAVARVVE